MVYGIWNTGQGFLNFLLVFCFINAICSRKVQFFDKHMSFLCFLLMACAYHWHMEHVPYAFLVLLTNSLRFLWQEGELDTLAVIHSYEDGMPAGSHKTRLTALNVCILFEVSFLQYTSLGRRLILMP